MTPDITYSGHSLDKESQRILTYLEDHPESTSTEIRDAIGIEHSQSVTYRISEHLKPAGLVDYDETEASGAATGTRHYTLTEEGETWVKENREEVERPRDLEDAARVAWTAREIAREAREEAESAKDSVQNYRTKVARLKTRVTGREDPDYDGVIAEDGHEQRIGYLEDDVKRLSEQVTHKAPAEQAAANESRSRDNELKIADLQDDLDTVHDQLDDLRENMDKEVQTPISQIETSVAKIGTQIDELRTQQQQIDSRLREVEQKQSQGILSRLFIWRGN